MNKALKDAMEAAARAALEDRCGDSIYGVRFGAPPIARWPVEACKLVFLDFDGVLNSSSSIAQFGTQYCFSPQCVAALNEILRQSGAKIVVTSSWRENWSLKEIAGFLEKDGVIAGCVIGKTGSGLGERGAQIDSWLRNVPFPVKAFVIIDDRNDMAMHRARLIQTNAQVGLTMTQAYKAITMLNTTA